MTEGILHSKCTSSFGEGICGVLHHLLENCLMRWNVQASRAGDGSTIEMLKNHKAINCMLTCCLLRRPQGGARGAERHHDRQAEGPGAPILHAHRPHEGEGGAARDAVHRREGPRGERLFRSVSAAWTSRFGLAEMLKEASWFDSDETRKGVSEVLR